jgi:glycopeptide antibiotics resistance protein
VSVPTEAVRSARWAIGAYVIVLAALTLSREADDGGLLRFYLVVRDLTGALTFGRSPVSFREAEALANLVLFLPLGALLALALPRVLLLGLLCGAAITSVGIEVVQYVLLPQRVPSALDVMMNTAGAAVGLVLGGDARRLLQRWRPDG